MSENFVLFDLRMGDKADWGDFFLKHLIDVCKGEIEVGNRPQGLWTSTGWKNIVAKFEAKTGDKRTKIQLKNKLDNLKKNMFGSWSLAIMPLDLDGMQLRELLIAPRIGGMNTLL
jgi:hypothetical protein